MLSTQFEATLRQTEAAAKLQPWGLAIENQLVRVDRPGSLRPETILFGDNNNAALNHKVEWGSHMRGKPVLEVRNGGCGRVVVIVPREFHARNLLNFLNVIQNQLRTLAPGTDVSFRDVRPIESRAISHYLEKVTRVINENEKSPVGIVVVIVPMQGRGANNRGPPIYDAIKTRLTCDAGIPSQIITNNNRNFDDRKAASVASKIAIQMLAKTGSIPWGVDIPPKSLMVVGIDVFHDKTKPSVLAFVASMNPMLSQ